MRDWFGLVLMVVAMSACHPRYAPLDDGGGGPGGLDSIRARILASIAARHYDQAREYLKLAANMADDEQARFEQQERRSGSGCVMEPLERRATMRSRVRWQNCSVEGAYHEHDES
jgi:hypothetical protein